MYNAKILNNKPLCGKSYWIGTGYFISTGGGQGNNRTAIRDRFAKILREKGYDVLHFDKMD